MLTSSAVASRMSFPKDALRKLKKYETPKEDPPTAVFFPEPELLLGGGTRVSKFNDIVSEERLRREVLHHYPLADLFVSPGHCFVSTPPYGQIAVGPIIIGLTVVQEEGNRVRLQRADIWEGHYWLLLAWMNCRKDADVSLDKGLSWITDQNVIRDENIVLLIDGFSPQGERYPRSFKLSGLLLHYPDIEKWSIAAQGLVSKKYRVGLHPDAPPLQHEWRLDEADFLPQPTGKPQIGLYFGGFDPVHNGHLGVIEYLLRENRVEKLIVVPKAETANQKFQASQTHRLNILKLALQELVGVFPDRLFLFLRNSEYVESMSSRVPFIEGVAQAFGVHPDDIYHVEGLKDGDGYLGPHRTLVLPRSLAVQTCPVLPCLHPESTIDNLYIDRSGLSSSLVRRWLQVYRARDPHIWDKWAENLVDASLPSSVKEYIQDIKLYVAEIPFYRGSPKALSGKLGFTAIEHNTSAKDFPIRGYLITTGAPERLEFFRRQVGTVGVHFKECLSYCGEYLGVHALDGRLLIVYEGSYLKPDRQARLERSMSQSDQSITIDRVLPGSLSNSEVACFLSHYHVWSEAYSSGASDVLIVEDRVHFQPDFSNRLQYVFNRLRNTRYDICYLYRKPPDCNNDDPKNDDPKLTLFLTAYLVSRSGLEKLLGGAFPINNPADFYVDETIGSHSEGVRYITHLVDRNADLPSTIAKYSI